VGHRPVPASALLLAFLLISNLPRSAAALPAQEQPGAVRAYLGVTMRDVTPEEARVLGMKAEAGVWIIELSGDSPAKAAGVQVNDLVLLIDRRPIQNTPDLITAPAAHKPGDVVELGLYRNGESRLLKVKLGRTTEAPSVPPFEPAARTADSPQASPRPAVPSLALQPYNGGFFTVLKPANWQIVTAGQCSQFAFRMFDPTRPSRQALYFGEAGPVYMSEQQRALDAQASRFGGAPIPWLEMPVVSPLTPANYLMRWQLIAQSSVARQFMPQCPRLEDLRVVAAWRQNSPLPGGAAELMRAVFREQGDVSEGLFMLTVAPGTPFTGAPGAGNAWGFLIVGISAPKMEFGALVADLDRAIGSLQIAPAYTSQCIAQSQQIWTSISRTGQILSETSDIIINGWRGRTAVENASSERNTDALRGVERLYDRDTGQIYEFQNGFYDRYSLDRGRYNLGNLAPVPNDKPDLWTQPVLDGGQHLRTQ
jgi:hypothetical protein